MCEVREDLLICDSWGDLEERKNQRCVPTQTQIREQLGSKLSDVFFENLCSEARIWLGLEPSLLGPDTVWVDPEARLKEKVTVTPVPEPAVVHLKALTHGSVLEVGQQYIQLLENKHRIEMEEALKRQAEELEEEWKRKMSDSGIESSGNQCTKVVATLMEHFDACFNDLVKTTQLRMRKECQLKVEEERAEVAAYMLVQLQEEVERRDYELCNDFHEILYSELNILASRYIEQINKEREIAIRLIQETVRKYEKMLADLKTEMELCSVIDVCRAITQERIENNERIRKIETGLRSNQGELLTLVEDLKTQNATLQKMSTERLKRLIQWRVKIRAIVLEFQRFINFALQSMPGHSEFLLSLERLMPREFPEDAFILPEEYQQYKDCVSGKRVLDGNEEERQIKLKEMEEMKRDGGSSSEKISQTSIRCRSDTPEDEIPECNFNFDYDQFKSVLVKRFAPDLKPPKEKRKSKRRVCSCKKRQKEKPLDKSNELYQMLTLVGENEKEQTVPVDDFLKKRLDAIFKICQDDPEFAKMILGCPEN